VLDRVSDASIAIASVALLGLVVVQGWQVFARYVINDSPSWTEPVTIVLLAAAMSFGAASGVHTGRHFGFFLLAQAMGPLQRRIVDTVVNLVVAAIGAVLLMTINRALPILGIPDFWQRAVVGVLIIGAIVLDRVLAVRQRRRLIEARDDES